MEKPTTVEDYISKHPEWEEMLHTFRELLLETELTETIKWGSPVYTLDNKNLVGFSAFKNHTGLWFFQGVFLDDPDNRLINAQKGKTKALRQLRFEAGDTIDKKIIQSFIHQAIQNQKAGKEIKSETKKLSIPSQLSTEFSKNPKFREYFDELSPGRQREYAEYISEAKQDATKQRRLQKIIPMVEKGIGLNDKYR